MKRKQEDPFNGGSWLELEEDKLVSSFLSSVFLKKNPNPNNVFSADYTIRAPTKVWIGQFQELFKKMRDAGVEPSFSARRILDELMVLDVMEM